MCSNVNCKAFGASFLYWVDFTKNSGHSHLYFVATNDDDGEKYQTKLLEESFFGLTFYAAART